MCNIPEKLYFSIFHNALSYFIVLFGDFGGRGVTAEVYQSVKYVRYECGRWVCILQGVLEQVIAFTALRLICLTLSAISYAYGHVCDMSHSVVRVIV